jgi:hypothetical protein
LYPLQLWTSILKELTEANLKYQKMIQDFATFNQLNLLRTEKTKAYISSVMAGKSDEKTRYLLEEIMELNNKITQYKKFNANGNVIGKEDIWSKKTSKIIHF